MVSPTERSIAAIVAAGGRGSRFAADKPKQFLELKGKPIYYWSVSVLLQHPDIRLVVLVMPPDMVPLAETQADELFGDSKKNLVVTSGGDSRQESVYKGLQWLEKHDPPKYALVHDAARPFLDSTMLDAVIRSVEESGACTIGMKPSDTIKVVRQDNVAETLDRESLLVVQTPQAGNFQWLMAAHKLAAEQNLTCTDDAAVLEAAGHTVKVVIGSVYNMKVTQPLDLILSDALADILLKDRL